VLNTEAIKPFSEAMYLKATLRVTPLPEKRFFSTANDFFYRLFNDMAFYIVIIGCVILGPILMTSILSNSISFFNFSSDVNFVE
jgi:hypothetical protein